MPILIGIFLIIFAAMGVIYFQEQREQNTIQSEIDTLNLQLSHKVEISEKLAADYQAALDAFPIQPVDEDAIRNFKKDVIVEVRKIAELPESDVDIISITSSQTFQPKSIGCSSGGKIGETYTRAVLMMASRGISEMSHRQQAR